MTNVPYKLTRSALIYGDTFCRNEANIRQWFPQLAEVTDHDLDALLEDILHVMGKFSGGFYETVKQNATIGAIVGFDSEIIMANGNGWEVNWERPIADVLARSDELFGNADEDLNDGGTQ
jgi:hypothetical protein